MFGTRLKKIRTWFKLSQSEFADKLGVDKTWISLLENNKRDPGNRLIRDICDMFAINEIWILTGKEEMFKPEAQNALLLKNILELLNTKDSETIELVEKLIKLKEPDFKTLKTLIERLSE
ncbi:helix-turn-helix domain-containing protein [uncultured Clostridium sp.]|uniref:helix-turn-helix domain-containing protein n=1 Tax=uncultured Clostridium sp. TaxID=59620 RepID=UPI002602D91B|nr:helix-turn-helix transcriptional regulator [uncultured Clostridium sp.]